MSSMTILRNLPFNRRKIEIYRKADGRFVKSLPLTEATLYEAARMGRAGEFRLDIKQGIYRVYEFHSADVLALRSDDRETRRAAARKASDFLLRNYPEGRA